MNFILRIGNCELLIPKSVWIFLLNVLCASCSLAAQALAAAPFSLPVPALWLVYARALQRVAVTNSVLLMRLEQVAAEATSASAKRPPRVECDWSLSAVFPVFSVRLT